MFFWFQPSRHQCSVLETDRKGKDLKAIPDEHTTTYGLYERIYNISECPVCGKEYPYNHSKFERVKTITFTEYNLIKECK